MKGMTGNRIPRPGAGSADTGRAGHLEMREDPVPEVCRAAAHMSSGTVVRRTAHFQPGARDRPARQAFRHPEAFHRVRRRPNRACKRPQAEAWPQSVAPAMQAADEAKSRGQFILEKGGRSQRQGPPGNATLRIQAIIGSHSALAPRKVRMPAKAKSRQSRGITMEFGQNLKRHIRLIMGGALW